jgi:peptide/nickel transport system substrate-binding protein
MDAHQETPSTELSPAIDGGTKKSKRALVIAIVIGAGIALGVSVAAYLLLNKSTPSTQGNTKQIKQLIVGMNGESFDIGYPRAETALSTGQVSTNAQVYEGLVRYEKASEVKPLLATSWTNPQGATDTWEFTLKSGVKFHTGRIMSASDVKYSIEAMIESGTESSGLYANTIKEVVVLSPSKVRIITKTPDPLLLNKLTNVFIIDEKSDKENDPINGTGPFTATKGAKQTSSRLDLTAFDGYHSEKSNVQRLIFKNYEDYDALISAIKKKEVDIGGDVPNDALDQFMGNAYATIVDKSPVGLYFNFRVNKSNSPINKKEVREAFQLAIDREKFFKATGFSGEVIDQLIPKQIPGHNPSIAPIKRDVAKAKQLLAAAGYSNGVNLELYHFSNISDEALKVLQGSAAEANITLKSTNFPNEDTYGETMDQDVPDIAILGWASSFNDGIDFFDPGLTSLTGVKDETFVNLYAAAESEFEPQKRLQLLQDLSKYTADNTLVVPAYSREYYVISNHPDYVYSRDIAGITFSFYFSKTYRK